MRLLFGIVLIISLLLRVESKLNVHIVAHTHDDVGWLKTVTQYFYGANNSIQHAAVQYILDSVIPALEQNPARKFIYVEQAFFQMWWAEQSADMQNRVKTLVSLGQFEFINGGWAMHDEGVTHYVAMIDQTTLGHKRIKEQFGIVPRIGWQIDPFGHSASQASLLTAEIGHEATFFARIDAEDANYRKQSKTMEFIWQSSPTYGSTAQAFSGAFLSGSYCPNGDFDYDSLSHGIPVQDDEKLEDYNVNDRIEEFVQMCNDAANSTQGNNIMFTMGCDFHYSNANTWFKNLDKLMKYVNQDGRVNVFYSTPSQYYDAKMSENLTYSIKTDDFFPISQVYHGYWTGYFTSRPALKRHIRRMDHLVNLLWQIEVFSNGNGSASQTLWEADSVAQHHDGVSGTSKQHVAYDYARLLSEGFNQGISMANNVLGNWLTNFSNTTNVTLTHCHLLNESYCPISQQNTGLAIVIYNSLLRTRQEIITVPINDPNIILFDSNGNKISYQVIDNPASPVVLNNPPALWNLVFRANLPALGYTTYFTQPSSIYNISNHDLPITKSQKIQSQKSTSKTTQADELIIENNAIRVNFSKTTGLIQGITNKLNGLTTIGEQQFYYWQGIQDSNQVRSGAYFFRPIETDNPEPATTNSISLELVSGPIIQEVRQTINNWLTQIIRLNTESFIPEIEFRFAVGSIPIDDGQGKEIVTRYRTDIQSNKSWYTDSNGREMVQRIKDYRASWNYTVVEPISGNYAPVSTSIYLRDSKKQFTILNDRGQGGSSLSDGVLEVMIHRRTLGDDDEGVGEPLNETCDGMTPYPNPVRLGPGLGIMGTHKIQFTTPNDAASYWRPSQDLIFSEPFITFTAIPISSTAVLDWIKTHITLQSFANNTLPANIQLMTLQPWNSGSILLRLSHQFAINEDTTLSQVTSVDIASLFANITISSVKELSLTANQNKLNMKAKPVYQIKQEDQHLLNNHGQRGEETKYIYDEKDSTKLQAIMVSLGPMEIKTFQVTFKKS